MKIGNKIVPDMILRTRPYSIFTLSIRKYPTTSKIFPRYLRNNVLNRNFTKNIIKFFEIDNIFIFRNTRIGE